MWKDFVTFFNEYLLDDPYNNQDPKLVGLKENLLLSICSTEPTTLFRTHFANIFRFSLDCRYISYGLHEVETTRNDTSGFPA